MPAPTWAVPADALRRGIGCLSRADWLARHRILAYAGILLSGELLFFCFIVLWQHGAFVTLEAPTSTDFISFYAAGKLALTAVPALVYDQAAHAAAEVAAAEPGIAYNFFFYPPTYLLLCAPLAKLPYLAAFVVLEATAFAAWLLVMHRILAMPGWAWCVPIMAYPAVFWSIGLGQNALLTAALLGGMTLLLDERPVIAGLLAGMLCYKPHLAMLVPIALAAGGRWRTFAAATVTVAALVGLSIALFGVDTWRAYLNAAAGSGSVYETGRIELAAYVTPYGAARLLGAGIAAGRCVQAVCSIAAAIAVGWIWRRNPGPAVRSAALAAAIPLSVPVTLMYDLLLLTVAVAWLVRAGTRTGFLPWEKLALFGCFLVPLLSRHLGQATHVPIGPLAPAALLAVCIARTARTVPSPRTARTVPSPRTARIDPSPRTARVLPSLRTARDHPEPRTARDHPEPRTARNHPEPRTACAGQ